MSQSIRAHALSALLVAAIGTAQAHAQSTLVQWNFNSSSLSPSIQDSHFLATPTVSAIGGPVTSFQTASQANGSSDFGVPNLSLQVSAGANFPAQGTGSGTAGFEYDFNTTNYTLSNFSFDMRSSGGPSGWMEFEYTTDGTTWNPIPLTNFPSSPNVVGNDIFIQSDVWTNQQSASQGNPSWFVPLDLSSLPGVNNDPHFGIRQVAVFSPVAFTDGAGSHAANTAYMRADSKNSDGSPNYAGNGTVYTNTSTWRDDMPTLTGTYVPPSFTPVNLNWNAASGTWDTVAGNTPWLNGATASPFHQNGGFGDNVTFNNPASGSVVTVQAGGVTPNSININTNGTLTFTGGSIGGTGGLVKTGTGTLILDNSNTFTGATGSTSITGGIFETHNTSPLGTGPVSLTNVTWNATTNAQASAGVVTLNGAININNTSDLTLSGGLAGGGTLAKGGAGTLVVGGQGTNTGAINITAGNVQLNSMNALGGNPVSVGNGSIAPGPDLSVSNAGLILNATGSSSDGTDTRDNTNVTLNNATLSRGTPFGSVPGSSKSNGDSVMSAYDSNSIYSGGVMKVSGNTTFINNEVRTAAVGDSGVGPGTGHSNQLGISMPVLVTSGSTLTANAVNGSLSNLTGPATFGLAGTLANTAVAFHGASALDNPNDSITLQSGASFVMAGAGEKRIGSGDTGKVLIGEGTAGAESTFKADTVTFMTDAAGDFADTNKVNSQLVVAGSGLNGLRVEAPLNANYFSNNSTPDPTTGQIGTSGLFGDNPDTSSTSLGSVYTIMSANRYAGLSGFDGMPTQDANGAPVTLGGTLTLAATDSGTGVVDNGPAVGTSVKLGLDNTATSGTLNYNIDPNANSGAFANFGGLVLKQTNAVASVTTSLLGDVTLQGANPAATTYDQSGGNFNLNSHNFTIGGAANVTGGHITGGGTFTAAAINITGGGLTPSAGPASPTTLTLQGTTTLGAGSSLNYELGTSGAIGGGVNSLTEVQGNLTLGGTLNVTGLTGFGVGAYRLADYTGTLTNNHLNIGSLPANFTGSVIDTSHAGQVNLDVITILGDVNGDHVVNGLDISLIASHWLQSGFGKQGDGNFDNVVNGLDISLVASHWLQSGGFGGGGSSVAVTASAVPEPGTYALCVTGLLAGLATRGIRRRK